MQALELFIELNLYCISRMYPILADVALIRYMNIDEVTQNCKIHTTCIYRVIRKIQTCLQDTLLFAEKQGCA